MAKIEGTETREFVVATSLAETYAFFRDPSNRRHALMDLDTHAQAGDADTWVFELIEQGARGVRFKARFTLRYTGNDRDLVTWESVPGGGNVDISGQVRLSELADGQTRVVYTESSAPDLPIPRILVRVFRPIVAREVKKGITGLIRNTEAYLRSLQ